MTADERAFEEDEFGLKRLFEESETEPYMDMLGGTEPYMDMSGRTQ